MQFDLKFLQRNRKIGTYSKYEKITSFLKKKEQLRYQFLALMKEEKKKQQAT